MNIQIINNLIQESKSIAEEITQQVPSSTLDFRIADFLERVRPFALQTIESPAKQQELKESLENLRTACAGYKPITSDPSLLNLSERITQFIKPLLKLEGKQDLQLNITEYLTHKEIHALSAVSKDLRIIAAKEKIKRLNEGISVNELGLTECSLIKLLKLPKTDPVFSVLISLNLSNFVAFNLQSILNEIPPTIIHLAAQSCGFSDCQVDLITRFPNLTNLSYLDLGENHIGPAGVVTIVTSPHLAKLSVLGLKKNRIGSEGAVAIANSPQLTNLSFLGLSLTNIGSKGAIVIASSPHLTNLSHLDLSRNSIGPEGAVAIANSPQLINLLYLDLGLNRIGSEGAVAIANSPHLTNLSHLDLSWNSIGPEGVVAIANSSNLNNLTTLHLRNNSIGFEETAAIIANSPFLISLRILDNQTVRFRDKATPFL